MLKCIISTQLNLQVLISQTAQAHKSTVGYNFRSMRSFLAGRCWWYFSLSLPRLRSLLIKHSLLLFRYLKLKLSCLTPSLLPFWTQGFDQLRIEGLLCDVTLVAGDGDEAFPVHRAMMASSSDYFKAMFTGGSAKPEHPLVIRIVCIELNRGNLAIYCRYI